MLRHDEEGTTAPGRNPSSPCIRKATKAGQSPAFAEDCRRNLRRKEANVERQDVRCAGPNVLSHRTPGRGDPAPTPDQAGCSSRIRHSRTLDGTTLNCRKDRRKPARYTCNGQPSAPLPTPSRHHTACRKALPSARRPDGEICSGIPQMAHVHERYAGGRHTSAHRIAYPTSTRHRHPHRRAHTTRIPFACHEGR